MDRLLRTLRRHPWAWGMGLGLGTALLVTMVVRVAALRAVKADPQARQAAAVESALTTVGDRFAALRKALHGRAQALSADSGVVRGLQVWRDRAVRSSRLMQHVAERSPVAHTTLEVYAPETKLLAWTGPHMPIDSTRFGGRLPRGPRTTVVKDGNGRWALAAWTPVEHAGRVLGAVRVARIVRYRPPIQNRYVRARSLADRWGRRTGEVIRVRWTDTAPSVPHRALRGVDGTVLGYVSVNPPSPERLVQRTASFYNDLLAAGVVGLIGWGLVLAVVWFLRLARRDGLWRHPEARRAAGRRLIVVALIAVGARYAILLLHVPARWAVSGTGIAPLFDPTYFASTLGGGILRSIGDLLLTGLWGGGLAVGLMYLARHYRPRAATLSDLPTAFRNWGPRIPHVGHYLGTLVGLVVGSLGGVVALALVVRRAVLDSTLGFFSRTGLLPEPLVLGVLCGLFLLVAAGILAGIGGTWGAIHRLLRHRPRDWPRGVSLVFGTVLFGGGIAALYLTTEVERVVSLPYMLVLLTSVGTGAIYGLVGDWEGGETLTLRGLLSGLFAVTLLLYPLLYAGMDAKRQEHMVDAARTFERGQDPRVLYSIRQVLRSSSQALAPVLGSDEPASQARIDSIATRLVRQSLLASLTTYEVRLSVLGPEGTLRTQYTTDGRVQKASLSRAERAVFTSLRAVYGRTPGPVVDQLAQSGPVASTTESRFQYAGLLGLPPGRDSVAAWVLLRVEPQSLLPGSGIGGSPVLLPNGSFGDLYADLSLAEFRNGTLVQGMGEGFGRIRLSSAVRSALAKQTSLWRRDVLRDRQYLTYYRRFSSADGTPPSTVAVRIPAVLAFDHLYYLLRLTVAGLCVGLVVYLLGLYVRYRRGRLPASRLRFRNKVLNAFLVVGIVSMVAVGIVGVRVVTGENERTIERRMQEHLARVEATLSLE
ncbi:MAG: histidine kinase, partial [Salinibacter sp.]